MSDSDETPSKSLSPLWWASSELTSVSESRTVKSHSNALITLGGTCAGGGDAETRRNRFTSTVECSMADVAILVMALSALTSELQTACVSSHNGGVVVTDNHRAKSPTMHGLWDTGGQP